jgi:hypothetical protein
LEALVEKVEEEGRGEAWGEDGRRVVRIGGEVSGTGSGGEGEAFAHGFSVELVPRHFENRLKSHCKVKRT